jgi:hypothetical protein
VKKKTVQFFVVSAVFLIALLGVMAALLLRDDPLTPMAEKALRYQPPSLPPAENAFVGLAGLNAPAGSDFIAVGAENIHKSNQDARLFGSNSSPAKEARDEPDAPELAPVSRYTYSCAKEITENCLEDIQADAPNIHEQLAQNEELIQRYLKIQAMPQFSNEAVSVMGFTPPYGDAITLSRLLSAKAALDIQNGKIAQGLDFLEKDMRFYRRILASTEKSLVDQMIATACIQQQAILLTRLFEKDALRGQTGRARALLTPFDAPREQYIRALWLEEVSVARLLDNLANTRVDELIKTSTIENPGKTQKGSFLANLQVIFLFKRNMSLNLNHQFFENEIAIIREMPTAQIYSGDMNIADEVRTQTCTIPSDFFICNHWRNFVGEILIMIGRPNYTNYLQKIHDADAHIRLARAQLEFRQAAAQESSESPEEILARLGPETFNPYTGQPFAWNPERKTIGFMPAAARDRKKWREVRLDFPTP